MFLCIYIYIVFPLKLILHYKNSPCNFKVYINIHFNDYIINWVELHPLLNNFQFLLFCNYKQWCNTFVHLAIFHRKHTTSGISAQSVLVMLSNKNPPDLCAYNNSGLFLAHAICPLQKSENF